MEYVMLLGLNLRSLFSSASISGMLLLIGSGIAITLVGYLLKGIWGACIALGTGTILFLYFKNLLPF